MTKDATCWKRFRTKRLLLATTRTYVHGARQRERERERERERRACRLESPARPFRFVCAITIVSLFSAGFRSVRIRALSRIIAPRGFIVTTNVGRSSRRTITLRVGCITRRVISPKDSAGSKGRPDCFSIRRTSLDSRERTTSRQTRRKRKKKMTVFLLSPRLFSRVSFSQNLCRVPRR